MARFNAAVRPPSPDTTNLAGGDAFAMTPELELATVVLSSKLGKDFYRSSNATMNRIVELVGKVNPLFAAKAAVYARRVYGMRSTSHVVAAAIGKRVKGEGWTKDFFRAVVRRPDDLLESLACYQQLNGGTLHPVPNAMKKGFGAAIAGFDAYALGKYRGEGKAVKMIDAVNLLRPKPTARSAEALKALAADTLRSTETWESKLAASGEKETAAEVADAKAEAWGDLLRENRLGYLALIRNLRNILDVDALLLPLVCQRLVNADAIVKSLVMPYQIYIAYKEIAGINTSRSGRRDALKGKMSNAQADTLMDALDQAFELSCGNLPAFDGETLVAVDSSGSMDGEPFDMAAPIAVALAKAHRADVILFDTGVRVAGGLRRMPAMEAITALRQAFIGGGTDLSLPFRAAAKEQKKYDNIIILSDMQSWAHSAGGPSLALRDYRKEVGADPAVFMLDVTGYGTSQFPERKVATGAGFTRETLRLMQELASDPRALIARIEAVSFDDRG